MKKNPHSHLVLAALASAVLYFVFDLSRSGRTLIDWAVIGLVVGAVLWNLFRLGRRLYESGGLKDVWHLLRTVGIWTVGWFNTALIRPEDVGSWKHWVGGVLLILAVVDSVFLFWKEQRTIGTDALEQADAAQG